MILTVDVQDALLEKTALRYYYFLIAPTVEYKALVSLSTVTEIFCQHQVGRLQRRVTIKTKGYFLEEPVAAFLLEKQFS